VIFLLKNDALFNKMLDYFWVKKLYKNIFNFLLEKSKKWRVDFHSEMFFQFRGQCDEE
jgi:hypothetical protein